MDDTSPGPRLLQGSLRTATIGKLLCQALRVGCGRRRISIVTACGQVRTTRLRRDIRIRPAVSKVIAAPQSGTGAADADGGDGRRCSPSISGRRRNARRKPGTHTPWRGGERQVPERAVSVLRPRDGAGGQLACMPRSRTADVVIGRDEPLRIPGIIDLSRRAVERWCRASPCRHRHRVLLPLGSRWAREARPSWWAVGAARNDATFYAMARMRISTTVDAEKWATARRLVAGAGSRVVDRALAALIEQVEREHERAVLTAEPYEADDDLSWQAPPGPGLPYDGAVPLDVRRLANRRRAERKG